MKKLLSLILYVSVCTVVNCQNVREEYYQTWKKRVDADGTAPIKERQYVYEDKIKAWWSNSPLLPEGQKWNDEVISIKEIWSIKPEGNSQWFARITTKNAGTPFYVEYDPMSPKWGVWFFVVPELLPAKFQQWIAEANKPKTYAKALVVIDVDSNSYKTLIIGKQTWMAENLKTIRYNDNSSIALITDNTEWNSTTTGAYCWYKNDETNKTSGALYNWYTVSKGNICPIGWHVPTREDWTTLIDFLGGEAGAGDKLRATNFIPELGGERDNQGSFFDRGYTCTWWSSWTSSLFDMQQYASCHSVENNGRYLNSAEKSRKYGYSIRCIKD